MKYTYEPADEGFWINDDDPDLKKVWIPLPKAPSAKKIENYGLDPKNQIFHRSVMPAKLIQLDLNTKLSTPKIKWQYLLDNITEYEEEYEWIKEQWRRVEEGHWVYIKGKPYYITGDHYFTFTFWRPEGRTMDYRDRDRRSWHAMEFCEKDPQCLGIIWPKHRREGWTTRVIAKLYRTAMKYRYSKSGVQSLEEMNCKKNIMPILKNSWKNLPFFLKPAYSGVANPALSLEFNAHKEKDMALGDVKELSSAIIMTNAGEFAFDGYRLRSYFADEIGKTVSADIAVRHNVVKQCLMTGSEIVGFMMAGSTVEEMDARGGAKMKKLCDQSHYHSDDEKLQRDANGRTVSGLYLFFIPADDGLIGHIDKYGFSIRKTAAQYLKTTRDAFIKKGDMSGFASFRRMYPLKYRECWMSSGKGQNFDAKALSDRIDDIRLAGKTNAVRGNLEWVNNSIDTEVEFVPNPDGRFFISDHPLPEKRNKYVTDQRKGGGTFRIPVNIDDFVAGADAYRFKETKEKKDESKGGGCVFLKRNKELDPDEKPMSEWLTHKIACTYLYRPPTLEEYGEDMIKMCVYFSCEIDPENNIDFIETHFTRRGYEGYLYYYIDPATGKQQIKPGAYTNESEKEKIFKNIQVYISKHCKREDHLTFLQQCADIEDDMGDYDLFVAAGRAITASLKDYEIDKRYADRWGEQDDPAGKDIFQSFRV